MEDPQPEAVSMAAVAIFPLVSGRRRDGGAAGGGSGLRLGNGEGGGGGVGAEDDGTLADDGLK